MLDFIPDAERLTEVFTECAAPTFFLFVIGAIVDQMSSRLSHINDKLREAISASPRPEQSIDHYRARARLLKRGIADAVVAAIFTTLLLVVMFFAAFLSLDHAYGAALLFMLAAGMLGLGLFRLAQETRLALKETDPLLESSTTN